jgi:hypothetical protein
MCVPALLSAPSGQPAVSAARAATAKRSGAQSAVALPALVHTPCNILHHKAQKNRPAIDEILYTDTLDEHKYRQAVSAVVEELGWKSRATAIKLCGRAGVEIKCGGCDSPSIVPFRCRSRTCPSCAKAGAAGIVGRLMPKIEIHDQRQSETAWDGARSITAAHFVCKKHQGGCDCWKHRAWRLVTLTRRMKDVGDRWNVKHLQQQVRREASKLLAAWWRQTEWGKQRRDETTGRKRSRRDTSCVWGLEISPGGMVHFHVIVYGEFAAQWQLLTAWRTVLRKLAAVTDAKDGGVNVQALRGSADVKDAIREVLKYATKGETRDGKTLMPSAQQAAIVECAFRSVRRFGTMGALRKITKKELLDVQADDFHAACGAHCESCATVGEWRWMGLVGRDTVQLNGGFGLLLVLPGGYERLSPMQLFIDTAYSPAWTG